MILDGEYSSLLSQVLELFRRAMWTCLRVEYEDIREKSYEPVSSSGNGKYIHGKGDGV